MALLPKLPPTTLRGPRTTPLFGVMGSFLRFFGDPIKTMFALHRNWGDLVALADRDPAVVFAFGPEYNRIILPDPRTFENFSEVPMKVPPGSAPLRLNTALTSMNGDVHKRQRRMLMPAFSRAAVDGYHGRMAAIAEARADRMHAGDRLDVASEMMELTLCIAMDCLFGTDVSRDADSLGRLGLRYLQGLTSPGAMMFPVALPGTPYRRFLDVADKLEKRLRELIAEKRSGDNGNKGHKDMLSIMLDAHDEDGSSFTDTELIGQSAVMFIAGHETTAQTLGWTLFLLSQHPAVHRELVEELQNELHGAAPTTEQLDRLPVLDRVIKESMRLIPATPFMFFRRATAPFRLGEHDLPAKSMVILSPLITHRLLALYPEPDRFLPDRWKTLTPPTYSYIPFGAGPRTCIGGGFASQALRVVLSVLVQRFRFTLLPEARVSRKTQGITLGLRHGLPMRLDPLDAPWPTPHRVRGDIHEMVRLPD